MNIPEDLDLPAVGEPPPEAAAAAEPKGIGDAAYSELVHGLNNALVSILLNAQVIEWKLPSYSRLKRHLHEIERSAQRAGEITRRLGRFQENEALAMPLRARPGAAADTETRALAAEEGNPGSQIRGLPAEAAAAGT